MECCCWDDTHGDNGRRAISCCQILHIKIDVFLQAHVASSILIALYSSLSIVASSLKYRQT